MRDNKKNGKKATQNKRIQLSQSNKQKGIENDKQIASLSPNLYCSKISLKQISHFSSQTLSGSLSLSCTCIAQSANICFTSVYSIPK